MDEKWYKFRDELAVDIYQAISELSDKNVIISPAGLQTLLTTLLYGARGITAVEIAQVLHFSEHNRYFVNLKALIPDLEKYLLSLTTQIFIEKTYPISLDFQCFMEKHFLSEIHGINFRDKTESEKEINYWIGESRNQEVKGLLSFESMNEVTSLVLVSSVFLKPHHTCSLKKIKMMTMPFHVNQYSKVYAETMILREKRFCTMKSRKLDAQIIEMPFLENKLNMIIIIPNKLDGLADIESKIGSIDLTAELEHLWLSKVDLYLPKFKLEQTMQMKDVLSKIGMPTAFTNEANFSGISTSKSLALSDVIHKVLFEVDEAVIESSEENESNSYDKAPLNVLTEVKCDHPFLFIVLAKREILFVGRLQNPNEM